MADRLTQLQDTVNQQAEHFCNSIGILQQCSIPSKFAGFERTGSQTPQQQVQQQQEDYPQLFSTLISRCAKDIDTLIESLPSEESSIELQVQSLQRLEAENKESAEKLEEIVRKGELLLEKIQAALSDIAQSQLDMQYSS
ncbi:mediator of RNA polymerase II transcription subunit 21 [Anopheles funestus]|uniref:Mediator of RNA polymerase II transcription subunit 21 n=3 Tax=Myzomyia TaxID=59140 RepID=A0A182RH45_ANOFN|nr:mediator of RNA polymerase II transcription subunit 21 [Anopheles funestus]XP_052889218.1 mediator of RNA polymerase II transcription subunit 21 [Anopheles moucheti]XP_053657861.1 mediator of RNA polymerase II transcription subunit 21 [Anopheles marshallii]